MSGEPKREPLTWRGHPIPDHVIAGETWCSNLIDVVDARTREKLAYRFIVEAHAGEGWIIYTPSDENGRPMFCDDHFVRERVDLPIRFELR